MFIILILALISFALAVGSNMVLSGESELEEIYIPTRKTEENLQ